jgi:hypothetical protein
MVAVPTDDVLARVERDLARGFTYPALQRLASLTEAHPDDLDLRARRAAVNRQIGNRVEAGRWGFLTEEVTDAEVAAFERAWPKAWARLMVLKVRSDPSQHIGDRARRRLAGLVQAANAEGPAPVGWVAAGPRPVLPGSWRDSVGCLAGAFAVLMVVVLAAIGLIAVIMFFA